MKKRFEYALLFGIPGFFAAIVLSASFLGALAGFLWIYVFGDNPWPAWTSPLLVASFVLSFATLWGVSIALGYAAGKKNEQNPQASTKPIRISVAVTLFLILLIVLHQLRIGNIGPKSDSIRCADFCKEKGYSASGTPPRNSGDRSCSCFDGSGNEVLKISQINR
jgi:hypothetical protein